MVAQVLETLSSHNIKVISVHEGSSICFVIKKSFPIEIFDAISCLSDIKIVDVLDTKVHKYQYLFISPNS
jgi:hypothetical protein